MVSKKSIFVLLSLILTGSGLLAQTFSYPEGSVEIDTLIYITPEFKAGAVFFNDGQVERGAINIETMDQKVLFINPSGEITTVAGNEQINRVIIGDKVFYKSDQKFVEIIKLYGDVAFGVCREIQIIAHQKKGAYGMVSETSSIQKIESMYSDSGIRYELGKNQYPPFLYSMTPYLYNGKKFFIANKKNILKAFPAKKTELNDYFAEHKTDFTNVDEVQSLLESVISPGK